jgi:ketosteroid isomerase-like protein
METYLKLTGQAGFDQDLTSDQASEAIFASAHPDVEIHEPASLPQGGVHKGIDAWKQLHHTMRALWEQKVETLKVWDIPEDDVIVLYSMMDWTAKATGRHIRFPCMELLTFKDGLIVKVEIYHQDAKAVLDTLEPMEAADG